MIWVKRVITATAEKSALNYNWFAKVDEEIILPRRL